MRPAAAAGEASAPVHVPAVAAADARVAPSAHAVASPPAAVVLALLIW